MATVTPSIMGGSSTPKIFRPSNGLQYTGTVSSISANTKQYNSIILIKPDSNASEFKSSNVAAIAPTAEINTYGLSAGDKVLFWPGSITFALPWCLRPSASTGITTSWAATSSGFAPSQQGYNLYKVQIREFYTTDSSQGGVATGSNDYVTSLLSRHSSVLVAYGTPTSAGGSRSVDILYVRDWCTGVPSLGGILYDATTLGDGYTVTIGNANAMKVYPTYSSGTWAAAFSNVSASTYGLSIPYSLQDASGKAITGYIGQNTINKLCINTYTVTAMTYLWAVWNAEQTQFIKL